MTVNSPSSNPQPDVLSPPKVFWSWQNDYSPRTCRFFVRECLLEAIRQVAADHGLEDADRPEIDQDTRDEPGMVDIAATILNKIALAAVFVADLTPVAKSPKGKQLPNPNVLIELGWAMHRPGWERVIGVLNTAGGAKVEELPFDMRQRRIIDFELPEDADKDARKKVQARLIKDLKDALKVNLLAHAEEVAATADISRVAARPDNPSIWATASSTLTHNDGFNGPHRQSIAIPEVQRGYIRVIPAGWKGKMPSIADIGGPMRAFTVDAPSDSARDGDFGATEEGFVRYWISTTQPGPRSSTNITMFFESTGEFWMIHGSIIADVQGQACIKDHIMLGGWSMLLRMATESLDHFGARDTRLVEAGLFGVSDVHWFSEWQSNRTRARRNLTKEVRQSRDWSPEAQLTFLTDAYNRVRDLFALQRSSESEVTGILMQFDRGRHFGP